MRAKSIRRILLTDYPAVAHPGGLIVPSSIRTVKRVASERQAIWDIIAAQFPDQTEVCELTNITYSGSGTWCGFKAFFTYNDGITPRYLSKDIKGYTVYVNGYPEPFWPTWYEEARKREIFAQIRLYLEANDDTWDFSDPLDIPQIVDPPFNGIDTFWYGQAAYDPTDGCSLANGLRFVRRTNGNPYADLMQYTFGLAYQDVALADVSNIWNYSLSGAGNLVTGYNITKNPSPAEQTYYAVGNTALGNQIGDQTIIGTVREILKNENTLYDQLKMDGAAITATGESHLDSFNDLTGEYSGNLSAFTFIVPDDHNLLNIKYSLYYTVSVTTGSETSTDTALFSFTGDGTTGRVLEVPLPIMLPGTSVSLASQCVTVYQNFVGYNDFEAESDASWLVTTMPVETWQKQGRFVCGYPSLVGGHDFNSLEDTGDGGFITETIGGQCWTSGRMFQPADIIGWHDFDSMADGDYNVTPGAIGIRGVPRFFIPFEYVGYNSFDSMTDGDYTAMLSGYGFNGSSRFFSADFGVGYDDFDSLADGEYTETPQASGFAGVGRFFVVDSP